MQSNNLVLTFVTCDTTAAVVPLNSLLILGCPGIEPEATDLDIGAPTSAGWGKVDKFLTDQAAANCYHAATRTPPSST